MPPSYSAWQPHMVRVVKYPQRMSIDLDKTKLVDERPIKAADASHDVECLGISGACRLVAEYPALLNNMMMCAGLRHKRKALEMLSLVDAHGAREYVEKIPIGTLSTVSCLFLDGVSYTSLKTFVVPLFNDAETRHAAVAMLTHIEPRVASALLLPLFQEPPLQQSLLAVLKQIRYPIHFGLALNCVSPDVVLCISRVLNPSGLARLVAEAEPADLDPQGALVALMHYASQDLELLEHRILPLIVHILEHGESSRFMVLMRHLKFVGVEPMLALMRHIETDRMYRLFSLTNPELMAMLANGPIAALMKNDFDPALLHAMVDGLADASQHKFAAEVLRNSTDLLTSGVAHACSVPETLDMARQEMSDQYRGASRMRIAFDAAMFLRLCSA